MKKIFVIPVILSLMCLQMGGCASLQPEFSSKADKGSFGGALSGVLIGALVGNIPGALVGGIVGFAAGNAVGEHYDRKVESREEALKKHQLKDKEEKLVLEESTVDPMRASIGASVKTSVRYTIIASPDVKKVKITETRVLFNEKAGYLKLDERQVLRTQGTFSSTYRFTVPEKASKGDCSVITVISNESQTQRISARLDVV